MAEKVRVKESVAVRAPQGGSGLMIALRAGDVFDLADPVVKAYPWAFVRDGGTVEQATAAPGEMRRR